MYLLQIVVFATVLQYTAALDVLFAKLLLAHTCTHVQNDLFYTYRDVNHSTPGIVRHASSDVSVFFAGKNPQIPMRARVRLGICAQTLVSVL